LASDHEFSRLLQEPDGQHGRDQRTTSAPPHLGELARAFANGDLVRRACAAGPAAQPRRLQLGLWRRSCPVGSRHVTWLRIRAGRSRITWQRRPRLRVSRAKGPAWSVACAP